ncbi:MAG: L-2-amino-thiazoline-4-carboxylic acid hydrolase, partial [Alphaproteobacteria bacterium]
RLAGGPRPVAALAAELGEEKAKQLMRATLRKPIEKLAREAARNPSPRPPLENAARGFGRFAQGGALSYDVVEETGENLSVNVTRCAYAEFYNALGVPELGFLFSCSNDYDVMELLQPQLEFKRSQTLMQGASHCDFRFKVKD